MFISKNRRALHRARILGCVVALAATTGWCAAAGATVAGIAPAPFTPALRAKFDAVAAAATQGDDGAPAIAIAVVENGTLVYAHAAGTGDVASGKVATTATRFRAGAITKMFTAVAVLQLIESGRIKIDEPLATYLPTAPHAAEVTVRQLLSHTSGIADYARAAVASGAATKPTTPQGIVDSVASKPLEFVPAHGYGYSDTNYVLLGLTVESVTKQPLATYERENILNRAAMTQTSFGNAEPAAELATGYARGKTAVTQRFDPSWLYAADDIVTTASDLARFDIALMSGKLIASETFKSMAKSEVKPDAAGSSYGLGLTLRTFGDALLAGHSGGVSGYEALDEMLPAQRFGVIVLGNASSFTPARIELPILQAFLPSSADADAAAERRRASEIAASADPKITAELRALVTGLQSGNLDRGKLSGTMNAAFTADTVATEHAQFAKLGPLRSLVYRGKAPDPNYAIYEYAGTFGYAAQIVPLRIVFDVSGKIEGLYQK